jgi:hypothetical protein
MDQQKLKMKRKPSISCNIDASQIHVSIQSRAPQLHQYIFVRKLSWVIWISHQASLSRSASLLWNHSIAEDCIMTWGKITEMKTRAMQGMAYAPKWDVCGYMEDKV